MRKPEVLEFTDYRSFLGAYFDYQKQQNKQWSYQAWSKKLGLKNNTSILKILNGQREAGPAVQNKIARYFGFDDRRASYLSHLIALSKHRQNPQKLQLTRERLKKEFGVVKRESLDEQVFKVIANSIHFVIRQSTKIKDFNFSVENLQPFLTFPLSKREVRHAFDNLVRLGLLKQENGRWVRATRELNTTDDIRSEAIQKYHASILDDAKSALQKVPVSHREFGAVTLVCKVKDIEKAKAYLRQIQDEFDSLFSAPDGQGEEVYQLNLQFYPVTQFKKSEMRGK